MRYTLLIFTLGWALPALLRGQDNAELARQLKAMQDRIQALESEVETLKAALTTAPPGAPAEAPPGAVAGAAGAQLPAVPPPSQAGPAVPSGPGGLPYYAAQTFGNKLFNPEIAAIGTFRGGAGFGAENITRDPIPSLQMQEGELSFQAIVDPYARADVFLSFGESGVDLEEGYLTFNTLPGAFELRAGKMRSAFGKVNTMHLHVLPWIDRPLVTQNLLNGEEGISDAGLSLTRNIPAPGGIYLEATGQLFRGDSPGEPERTNLFQSYGRSSIGTVGHLRAYRDINESTNLDLGASYARGHNPLGPSLVTQIWGADATLRWKPLRRAIYHSFIGRGEFVWSRVGVPRELVPAGVSRPFGYYVSGEYQLNRRWLVGGRFDQSDRLNDSSLLDRGGSLLVTYRPSEFSQVRGQLRRTRYSEQATANEFLFQFMFSIGAHGAHPF